MLNLRKGLKKRKFKQKYIKPVEMTDEERERIIYNKKQRDGLNKRRLKKIKKQQQREKAKVKLKQYKIDRRQEMLESRPDDSDYEAFEKPLLPEYKSVEVPVTIEELQVGDNVYVDGETVRVLEIDDTGSAGVVVLVSQETSIPSKLVSLEDIMPIIPPEIDMYPFDMDYVAGKGFGLSPGQRMKGRPKKIEDDEDEENNLNLKKSNVIA